MLFIDHADAVAVKDFVQYVRYIACCCTQAAEGKRCLPRCCCVVERGELAGEVAKGTAKTEDRGVYHNPHVCVHLCASLTDNDT
jgi:hypothetical protein